MLFSLELHNAESRQSTASNIRRFIDRYHAYMLIAVMATILFVTGMVGAAIAVLMIGTAASYAYCIIMECGQIDFTCDLSDFDLRDVIADLES